jgi:arginine-glutamic acid dipeptide repeat-containing protein
MAYANTMERLSMERMQAERLAMTSDPMIRLQISGLAAAAQQAHTHNHAHNHTHLHLHGQDNVPPPPPQSPFHPLIPQQHHLMPPLLPGKRRSFVIFKFSSCCFSNYYNFMFFQIFSKMTK